MLTEVSRPVRARGLKHQGFVCQVGAVVSRPVRARELKPHYMVS